MSDKQNDSAPSVEQLEQWSREFHNSLAKSEQALEIAEALMDGTAHQLPQAERVLYRHPIHGKIEEAQERHMDALGLIGRVLLIHNHDPVFAPEDEMIARELATDHFRAVQQASGEQVPPRLVVQQQNTINQLSSKLDASRALLRSIANRLGHVHFGELAKEIDQHLNASGRAS